MRARRTLISWLISFLQDRHVCEHHRRCGVFSTPCRVAVAGASGRMGRMLIEAIRASDDCVLAGALDVPSSPAIGSDACAFLGYASGVPSPPT
jgi:hypothetical protein